MPKQTELKDWAKKLNTTEAMLCSATVMVWHLASLMRNAVQDIRQNYKDILQSFPELVRVFEHNSKLAEGMVTLLEQDMPVHLLEIITARIDALMQMSGDSEAKALQ